MYEQFINEYHDTIVKISWVASSMTMICKMVITPHQNSSIYFLLAERQQELENNVYQRKFPPETQTSPQITCTMDSNYTPVVFDLTGVYTK